MKTIIFLFIITSFLLSTTCKKTDGKIEWEVDPNSGEAIVISINDTTYYFFDPINRRMRHVMSQKSIHGKYFIIQMNNDTIEIGETFKGTVGLIGKNSIVKITSPLDTSYNSIKQGPATFVIIEFTPPQKGIYTFTGKIDFDSISIPFEDKFIVVEKGTRTGRYNYAGKIKRSHVPDEEEIQTRKKIKENFATIKGKFKVGYYNSSDSVVIGYQTDPTSKLIFLNPKVTRLGNNDRYIIVERKKFNSENESNQILYYIFDMTQYNGIGILEKESKFMLGPFPDIETFNVAKELLGIKNLNFTREFK